jgi:hypothetical protein
MFEHVYGRLSVMLAIQPWRHRLSQMINPTVALFVLCWSSSRFLYPCNFIDGGTGVGATSRTIDETAAEWTNGGRKIRGARGLGATEQWERQQQHLNEVIHCNQRF